MYRENYKQIHVYNLNSQPIIISYHTLLKHLPCVSHCVYFCGIKDEYDINPDWTTSVTGLRLLRQSF